MRPSEPRARRRHEVEACIVPPVLRGERRLLVVGVAQTFRLELGPQAELADLLLQALAHHADRGGGARHVAAVRAQRGEQVRALEVDDGLALRRGERALRSPRLAVRGAARRRFGGSRRSDSSIASPRREHRGLLDDVAQLAHVARPRVARERASASGAIGSFGPVEPLARAASRKWFASAGTSSRRSRSGGQLDLDDLQPVVEILAEAAGAAPRARGRGASRRRRARPPRRAGCRRRVRASAPASTRSTLACVAGGMSPISSRKIVPPWAASNLPTRRASAPVKAPFSWPKSSLSTSSRLIAAQFTATNGRARRDAALVQRLRDELLAGAALAAHQHGEIGLGDLADRLEDLRHRRGPSRSGSRSATRGRCARAGCGSRARGACARARGAAPGGSRRCRTASARSPTRRPSSPRRRSSRSRAR